MALGINNIVGVSGLFVGLILGGLLAPIDWRLVFLISVPVGLFGTVWAYLKLEERSVPRHASIDWWGNVTFAVGLVLLMVAVTYGIRPYGGTPTGWEQPARARPPRRLGDLAGGLRDDRVAGRRADVPARPVQDPRLHLRQSLDLPRRRRPRRA